MGKTYRRFSTEFKLRLVEAYLAGQGSMKRLATEADSWTRASRIPANAAW